MTLAYGYCRVSSVGQSDGDGFPRQREAIERYAAANGYEITHWYCEEISGTTDAELRPKWASMLAECQNSDVKHVIVERIDRVARDLMVGEAAIADIQKRGLTIISTAEPDLCSSDPTRILIRQLFGALAAYDRSMIVRKLRVARERCKAQHGKCEGPKHYGFYPGEKQALEEILRQRDVLGHSAKRIAESLNAAGFVARKGGAWSPRVVSRILAANGRRTK